MKTVEDTVEHDDDGVVVTPTPKKLKKKAVEAFAETKTATDTSEALTDLLAAVRDGGDPGASLLGSDGLALKIRGVISTQCPSLDIAIGRGGIPLGRLSILHGAEAGGKTSLALHLVAEVQRLGGIALYMDKEYKLDPDYAAAIGVDTKRLIITQPNHLEMAFKVHAQAIASAAKWRVKTKRRVPILIVLDSMNAAITKAQFEGNWEDKHMAPQARVYSEQLPRLIPLVSKEDVALCWISQVRKKMNVQYGDDDEIAGGKSARFYASLIIKIKRVGNVKVGDEKTGNKIIAECNKNQIAPPFKKAEFVIEYGHGVDREGCLLDLAMDKKVVAQKGNTFFFGEQKLGVGLAKTISNLRGAPKVAARIAAASSIPWRVDGIE